MVDPRSISYIPNWFSVHDSPRSATRTVDSHAYGFAAAADRLILAHSIQKTTQKCHLRSNPRTTKSAPPPVGAGLAGPFAFAFAVGFGFAFAVAVAVTPSC